MYKVAEYFSFRRIVILSIITTALLLAITFILFQARYLIIGPQITITSEPVGPQNEREVEIAGTAHNISHLWLNGRQIYTDVNGTFEEELILENGYTTMTLRAEDRFGRSTEITRTLVYSPSSFVR